MTQIPGYRDHRVANRLLLWVVKTDFHFVACDIFRLDSFQVHPQVDLTAVMAGRFALTAKLESIFRETDLKVPDHGQGTS